MKKLLVAAMGMAVAYGAFAVPVSSQRFEEASSRDAITIDGLNELAGNTYWSDTRDTVTNTYTIEEFGSYVQPTTLGVPTNALKVATKFGQPLELKSNLTGGETIGDGLYFDALVKFTVCDDDPVQEYTDAKIVMWLQEATNEVGTVTATNIMVRAGYLSIDDGKVAVDGKTYNCGPIGAIDIEKFHRVTIKAIQDITTADRVVPAFAIYIDGRDGNETAWKLVKCTSEEKWDGSFNLDLTSAADYLNTQSALFPSMVQSGSKAVIEGVGFDGTGSISDLTFTHDAPSFAVDHGAAVAYVTIGGEEIRCEDFESAVDAVNEVTAGNTATLKLAQNMALGDASLVFTAAAGEIVLDFNGFVLTNELAGAAITNNAATLIITNSVGNGGIYCGEGGKAIYDVGAPAASLTIQGGSFWGNVVLTEGGTYLISGGSFLDDTNFDEFDCLAEGKEFKFNEETQLYDVVDYVAQTCTITVSYGEHMTIAVTTNEVAAGAAGDYVLNIGDKIAVTYTAAAGYTLSKDSDSIASVSEDATIAAPTATPIAYAITYTLKTATGTAPVAGSYTVETASPVTLAQPAAVTGYTFSGWYDNAELTGVPVTTFTVDTVAPAAKAFYGQFTATTYTIAYKNADGTAFTAWADQYVAPDSFTVESEATLPTKDNVALGTVGSKFNGWTNDVGTAVTTTEGLTANLVVFANVTAGSTTWVADETTITENASAADVYSELSGSALASTDAKKLTVWAKANGKTVGAVAEAAADSDLYDAYLLNCSEAQLEDEKAAFAIPSITFDEDGKPVIAEPTGNYNGTIQKKGSDDLSTWTTIDGSTHKAEDYQFFKLELVP